MNPLVMALPQTDVPPLDLADPIAADLVQVEQILARELNSRYEAVAEVVGHVRHFRGKRLRPVLLLLAGHAAGQVTPAHHVLGAVVEMVHTATLVHDDILDNASVRRHVPTVSARWGIQTGVLLGDYLFTHAFYLASTLDDVRACRLIGLATNRVCEGELCQGLERGNLDLSERSYLDVIDGKTAELIACCCQLGAVYSGASEEVVASLSRFGRSVGMAFQIADDLLDLVGEEKAAGKSLGTDLDQQKMTLPLIHLLGSADKRLAAEARSALTGPGEERREALLPLLARSGSLDYARARAEHFATLARAELDCLAPSVYRTLLESLTTRVIHRSR